MRLTPTGGADSEVSIAFDFPVSDGRFWIDESQGVKLIIDKEDELTLCDCLVDFVDGKFTAMKGKRSN